MAWKKIFELESILKKISELRLKNIATPLRINGASLITIDQRVVRIDNSFKMATITWSAPDCLTPWPCTTPSEVLLMLIQLHSHTATSRPSTSTSTHFSQAQPASAKVGKVKRPMFLATGTSEDWSYLMRLWSLTSTINC